MHSNELQNDLANIKLLYVEDDEAIRAQISEFLERYIGSLIAVDNAEEAFELYKKHRPDILLLDVNLPGKNGLMLAQEIREENHDVRILVSTAYTDKEFLLQAVELELTRYLVKPLTGSDLLEAIQKALQEKERLEKTPKTVYLGKGFIYNCERKVLQHNEQNVALRKKEVELLEFFIAHKDQTLSYETLENSLWQETPMSRDAIRAQIRNLRKKLYPEIIENIAAVGYCFSIKGLS
jgi:DNA-binding response OmpR family regulator